MAYLYEACDKISDFCHRYLLRKMRRKISWTDRQTNSIPPSPSGERGYKNENMTFLMKILQGVMLKHVYILLILNFPLNMQAAISHLSVT